MNWKLDPAGFVGVGTGRFRRCRKKSNQKAARERTSQNRDAVSQPLFRKRFVLPLRPSSFTQVFSWIVISRLIPELGSKLSMVLRGLVNCALHTRCTAVRTCEIAGNSSRPRGGLPRRWMTGYRIGRSQNARTSLSRNDAVLQISSSLAGRQRQRTTFHWGCSSDQRAICSWAEKRHWTVETSAVRGMRWSWQMLTLLRRQAEMMRVIISNSACRYL